MATDPQIHLDPDREPWDRQPRESLMQYARFKVYLELGVGRTMAATVEILNATQDPIKRSSLQRTCWSYRWVERCQLWDVHQSEEARRRLIRLRDDMIERHRRLATGLIGKAVAAMRDIDTANLSGADIVRFLTLATELERKTIGEPDQRVAVSGPTGDGPLITEDISQYTPADRQRRLGQIATELARRAGRELPTADELED